MSMSTPDPLNKLPEVTARGISKAARDVERLKLRRRALLKKLAELDEEIRGRKHFLQALVQEATTPIQDPGPIDREEAEPLIDRAMEGRPR